MKNIFKIFIPACFILLLAAACSINEEPELPSQLKFEGKFTQLSPFDKRLMDLTAYLIDIDPALKKGEENGLKFNRLMWDYGHSYNTNGHEYIMVPFATDGTTRQCLVAIQKEDKFTVFIREAPPEEHAGGAINGMVKFKSITGIDLYSEWYQDGEMITSAKSSFNRLKGLNLEFGGTNMIEEVVVTAPDLSNSNTDYSWINDRPNIPTLPPDYNNNPPSTGGGPIGGGGGSYGGGSSSTGSSNNSFYPEYLKAKQANLTLTQVSTSQLAVKAPQSDFIANSKLVQHPDYRGYFYLYSGYWIWFDSYGGSQSIWVENNSGNGKWYDFEFDQPRMAQELTSIIAQIPVALSKQVARYALPIEDAYIVWTGVDFDGVKRSRYWAAGGILLAVVPGSKVLKPVTKISGTASKYLLGYSGRTIEISTSGIVHGVSKHWDEMLNLGTTLAKQGKYGKIYLNRSIHSVLGKYFNRIGRWRPDVMAVADDGTVFIGEVVSPSQTYDEIYQKVMKMVTELKDAGYKVDWKIERPNY